MIPFMNSKDKSNVSHSTPTDSGTDYYATSEVPALKKADSLIHDINHYLKKLDSSNAKWHKKAKETMLSAVGKFKSLVISDKDKKKEGEGTADAETYLAKLGEIEQELKSYCESAKRGSSSLLIQAENLQMRLVSCINFQNSQLPEVTAKLEESKILTDKLTTIVREVKDMLLFDEDLSQLKAMESGGYVPWTLRSNKADLEKKVYPPGEFNPPEVQKRLKKLQKAKKYAVTCLVHFTSRHTSIEDITKTSHASLVTISSVIEKAGGKNSSQNSNSKANNNNNNNNNNNSKKKMVTYQGFVVEFYDHSQCHDCECVNSMADECCLHLTAELNRSVEAQHRMDTLTKLKTSLTEVVNNADNEQGNTK